MLTSSESGNLLFEDFSESSFFIHRFNTHLIVFFDFFIAFMKIYWSILFEVLNCFNFELISFNFWINFTLNFSPFTTWFPWKSHKFTQSFFVIALKIYSKLSDYNLKTFIHFIASLNGIMFKCVIYGNFISSRFYILLLFVVCSLLCIPVASTKDQLRLNSFKRHHCFIHLHSSRVCTNAVCRE